MNRPGLVHGQLSRQRLLSSSVLTVVGLIVLDGRDVAEGAVEALARSTSGPKTSGQLELVDRLNGASGRTHSALYNPITLSARALSVVRVAVAAANADTASRPSVAGILGEV